MDLKTALEQFQKLQETMQAYTHATTMLEADMQSIAPPAAGPYVGKTIGILNQEISRTFLSEENGELLALLHDHSGELDDRRRAELSRLYTRYQRVRRMPEDLGRRVDTIKNEALIAWKKAKYADDFEQFLPHLERQVTLKHTLHELYDPAGERECYDFWLNEYAPGSDSARFDSFFSLLRTELVPLMRRCLTTGRAVRTDFLRRRFPVEQQRALARWLLQKMLPYQNRWMLGETEHPFGGGVNNHDLRIYTHFYEDNLSGAVYSTMHEGGHALQSMLQPDWSNDSILLDVPGDVGESQSRFHENIIGKSLSWIRFIFPKLTELFPKQLDDVTPEEFWRAVNAVEPCEHRAQAGELVYLFLIMIRYEIEKLLIRGGISAREVPEVWDALQREYLDLPLSSNAMGPLQDMQWALGLIGYFPSYAIGSAYGAQFLDAMERTCPDLWERTGRGDLTASTAFLKQHIYDKGNVYGIDVLLREATGQGFDPSFYIRYLKEKLQAVYGLQH